MQILNNQLSAELKITIPTQNGFEFVQVSDIIHCEAADNYCRINLTNGQSYYAKSTLKKIQSLLSPFDFIRVHNAHLINMYHIRRYIRTDGGYIELVNGTILGVSRGHKATFLSVIKSNDIM